MGEIKLWASDKIKIPASESKAFAEFLQRLQNRRAVGCLRYGRIKSEQRYMSRLEKVVKNYRKTGNAESLYDIAVYAFLESFAPENKRFHFDATAKSVTRKEFGGARE